MVPSKEHEHQSGFHFVRKGKSFLVVTFHILPIVEDGVQEDGP